MTAEQRQKVQQAIEALIDVESALQHTDGAKKGSQHLADVQHKLSEARHALVELNAPEYN
jgi:hypothetical protein